MSIETTCENCGAEYDLRHGECPSCTIEMEVRSARPPYETWPASGHFPFEVHGERFAVTLIPIPLNARQVWRVSHIATGVALPGTAAATKKEARDNAKAQLTEVGAEKLKAAIANVRTLFANPAISHAASGAGRST